MSPCPLSTTCKCTSLCGNEITTTQIVTIQDTTNPELENVPEDIIALCTEIPVAPAVTATDNCEGSITGTTTDLLNYTAQGTYTVTWTYADGTNTITQTQNVILNDVTTPIPDVFIKSSNFSDNSFLEKAFKNSVKASL